MGKRLIIKTDGAPIHVEGSVVSWVSTRYGKGSSERWTCLTVFEADTGELYLQRARKTLYATETDQYECWQVKTERDVIEKLGNGPLTDSLIAHERFQVRVPE